MTMHFLKYRAKSRFKKFMAHDQTIVTNNFFLNLVLHNMHAKFHKDRIGNKEISPRA